MDFQTNFFTTRNSTFSTGNFSAYNKNNQISAKEKAEKRENMTVKERHIDNFKELQKTNKQAEKTAAIDNKVKVGKKLSEDEKTKLKADNPELYQEAVKAEMERTSYQKAVENARTQEDVEKIKSNSLCKFASEIKEVINNAVIPKDKKLELTLSIARRFNNVVDAHNEFIKSDEYGMLPENRQQLDRVNPQNSSSVEDTDTFADDLPEDSVSAKDDAKGAEKFAEKSTKQSTKKVKVAQEIDIGKITLNGFKGGFVDIKV